MIVKGIVESASDRNSIKVRIPFLNGLAEQVDSTPTQDLPNAVLCQMPNVDMQLGVGDIVWVEFENTRWESPVIIGFLDIEQKTKISYRANTIEVKETATLPTDTTIGDVSAESINCLKDLNTDLAYYFNNSMQVYPLDLTAYDIGDEIPLSVIQSIPDDAYIIAIMMSESGTYRYYQLCEKQSITFGNGVSEEASQYPQYNYTFWSPFGVIKLTGRMISAG